MGQEQVRVNLKTLFVVLVGLIVLIVFGVGAFGNGDLLWFMPGLNEQPERIVIYRHGCTTELIFAQPGFADLTSALNKELPNYAGYSDNYGFSSESLTEYRRNEYAVEVFYPQEITIHTPYGFGHPDTLFIPLSSYFAESHSVFGGKQRQYWAGALRLKSVEAIQRAADAVPCSP